MKRTSPFYGLSHFVQCRDNVRPFYETIAAFNIDRAAVGYAEECIKANPAYSYRVMARKGLSKLVEVALSSAPVKTVELSYNVRVHPGGHRFAKDVLRPWPTGATLGDVMSELTTELESLGCEDITVTRAAKK